MYLFLSRTMNEKVYQMVGAGQLQLCLGQGRLEDVDVRPLLLQRGALGAQFDVLALLVAHQLFI